MKTYDVVQGSPEWLQIRLGRPTASAFDLILSPVKMKPSASQGRYMARLLAEWMIGKPIEGDKSGFMFRGTELEAEAVRYYEFAKDVETTKVGFCTTDDGRAGCSPDRLVGEDGGLEIKCPSAEVHAGYMLNPCDLEDEYRCQVQGQLWVTGRKWWDVMSYHPTMPKVIFRVEPQPVFIEALSREVLAFCDRLDAEKKKRSNGA